jgi:Kef-type K+ transport system membrane component KefB
MLQDWPHTLAPFSQLAVLLLVCACVGALFVWLRQPVLITYLIVGIALGPAGAGLVTDKSEIEMLAQLGVTVLLFIVGSSWTCSTFAASAVSPSPPGSASKLTIPRQSRGVSER